MDLSQADSESQKTVAGYKIFFTNDCLLGKGSFGEVYLCRKEETGEYFAVKKSNPLKQFGESGERVIALLEQQINMMQWLPECPNLVRFEHFCRQGDNFYIFMELCTTNLITELKQRKEQGKKLTTEEVVKFLKSIANGLFVLASKGIVHRDLKPRNILLKQIKGEEQVAIKIADFGLAICPHTTSSILERLQSRNQVEQYIWIKHRTDCDIISFGQIIYFLLFEKQPTQQDCQSLSSLDIESRLKQFLIACLQTDSKKRKNIYEIFKLSIFQSFFTTSINCDQAKHLQFMRALREDVYKNKQYYHERSLCIEDEQQMSKDNLLRFFQETLNVKKQFRSHIEYLFQKVDSSVRSMILNFGNLHNYLQKFYISFKIKPKVLQQYLLQKEGQIFIRSAKKLRQGEHKDLIYILFHEFTKGSRQMNFEMFKVFVNSTMTAQESISESAMKKIFSHIRQSSPSISYQQFFKIFCSYQKKL